MSQVACIGGAHRDIISQALQEIVLKSSNPVSTRSTWGGVARNIAENLARLKIPVSMLSRVGSDSLGFGLQHFLENLGIDTKMLTVSLKKFTASYTALLDGQGDTFVAIADTEEIYNELTPKIIKPHLKTLLAHPIWVIDLNLPKETLQFLADNVGQNRVVTMPVSVAKLNKISPILAKTDTIVLNRLELKKLAAMDPAQDLNKALNNVFSRGVSKVILTDGANDVIFATSQGEKIVFSVKKTEVCDVTGGGDALAAGYIFGMLKNASVHQAIHYGIEAARLTVRSLSSVCQDLSPEKLEKIGCTI